MAEEKKVFRGRRATPSADVFSNLLQQLNDIHQNQLTGLTNEIQFLKEVYFYYIDLTQDNWKVFAEFLCNRLEEVAAPVNTTFDEWKAVRTYAQNLRKFTNAMPSWFDWEAKGRLDQIRNKIDDYLRKVKQMRGVGGILMHVNINELRNDLNIRSVYYLWRQQLAEEGKKATDSSAASAAASS